MIFEKDLDALSEHLGRPHLEFLGTQVDHQPGRELQWFITADLRGKREPPISMRIHFSVMESNWLDGLARAMQEALARLCGQHVTELYGTRFAHFARHDSIGGPRALSPHPELKILAHERKTLRQQRANKDATIARLRAKIVSLEATVKAQEDQLMELAEEGEDIQGGAAFR
ncbi:hypothetical protein QYE76_001208 [Lolium multiflorum]|uniref:Uncharacterized protein n=1 Tax=Lolium multiflorum TaxID=4521 RepID=A0AAD8RJB2_LOLMU|nr:hypothetical protein QYE76_001208 [Lolium multiflorum]